MESEGDLHLILSLAGIGDDLALHGFSVHGHGGGAGLLHVDVVHRAPEAAVHGVLAQLLG